MENSLKYFAELKELRMERNRQKAAAKKPASGPDANDLLTGWAGALVLRCFSKGENYLHGQLPG
jgi:hypothetical protein